MRILLIEDDNPLGGAVRDHLAADGHAVDWVVCLADAEGGLRAVPYDLILLDLTLPDGLGADFLRRRRAAGDATPVIILTARDQISDRIQGLNAGADDYLVKPFDLSELSARIAAVTRRYSGNPNPLLTLGELEVDLAARAVYRSSRAVDLTGKEWVVFEALVQRPGAILSKRQLEERLYDLDSKVESNTVEVHVSRLRKKLGRDLIETVRGLGYRLGRP
jgi:two-component system OmpR family response regulator